MLGLARGVSTRFLLASASEVHEEPEIHPQPERYLGNVHTIGPRSSYDNGKRITKIL